MNLKTIFLELHSVSPEEGRRAVERATQKVVGSIPAPGAHSLPIESVSV